MKKICQFRIEDELQYGFKQYCISKDTTMSNVLIDYITTLVKKPGKSPAEKKNSVRMMPPTVPYHCPWCGKDITHLIPPDRLKHLQNCQNGRKE